MRKANHSVDRQKVQQFQSMVNVGPACERDFRRLGFRSPQELCGQDPLEMYRAICQLDGRYHDPCVLDVFMATVAFMDGKAPRPWWEYTPIRKRRYSQQVVEIKEKTSSAARVSCELDSYIPKQKKTRSS